MSEMVFETYAYDHTQTIIVLQKAEKAIPKITTRTDHPIDYIDWVENLLSDIKDYNNTVTIILRTSENTNIEDSSAALTVVTSCKTDKDVWFFQGWLEFDRYVTPGSYIAKVAFGLYIPSLGIGIIRFMSPDLLKQEQEMRFKKNLCPLADAEYFMPWDKENGFSAGINPTVQSEGRNLLMRARQYLEVNMAHGENNNTK